MPRTAACWRSRPQHAILSLDRHHPLHKHPLPDAPTKAPPLAPSRPPQGRASHRRTLAGPVRRRPARSDAGAGQASGLRGPGAVLRADVRHARASGLGARRGRAAGGQERQGGAPVGADVRRRQDSHADHAVPPVPRPCLAAGPGRGPRVQGARGTRPAGGVPGDALLRQDRRGDRPCGRAGTGRPNPRPASPVEHAGLSAGRRRRTARHPRRRSCAGAGHAACGAAAGQADRQAPEARTVNADPGGRGADVRPRQGRRRRGVGRPHPRLLPVLDAGGRQGGPRGDGGLAAGHGPHQADRRLGQGPRVRPLRRGATAEGRGRGARAEEGRGRGAAAALLRGGRPARSGRLPAPRHRRGPRLGQGAVHHRPLALGRRGALPAPLPLPPQAHRRVLHLLDAVGGLSADPRHSAHAGRRAPGRGEVGRESVGGSGGAAVGPRRVGAVRGGARTGRRRDDRDRRGQEAGVGTAADQGAGEGSRHSARDSGAGGRARGRTGGGRRLPALAARGPEDSDAAPAAHGRGGRAGRDRAGQGVGPLAGSLLVPGRRGRGLSRPRHAAAAHRLAAGEPPQPAPDARRRLQEPGHGGGGGRPPERRSAQEQVVAGRRFGRRSKGAHDARVAQGRGRRPDVSLRGAGRRGRLAVGQAQPRGAELPRDQGEGPPSRAPQCARGCCAVAGRAGGGARRDTRLPRLEGGREPAVGPRGGRRSHAAPAASAGRGAASHPRDCARGVVHRHHLRAGRPSPRLQAGGHRRPALRRDQERRPLAHPGDRGQRRGSAARRSLQPVARRRGVSLRPGLGRRLCASPPAAEGAQPPAAAGHGAAGRRGRPLRGSPAPPRRQPSHVVARARARRRAGRGPAGGRAAGEGRAGAAVGRPAGARRPARPVARGGRAPGPDARRGQ